MATGHGSAVRRPASQSLTRHFPFTHDINIYTVMDFDIGWIDYQRFTGAKHGAAKRDSEHTRTLEKQWHGSTVGGEPANLAETLRPIAQRAIGPRGV